MGSLFQANAKICAGQEHMVDILINSTAMLVLNELDNIFFLVFEGFMTEDEEDELIRFLVRKADDKDKNFAFYYSMALVVFMIYYSGWFILDRVYVNKVLAGIMTFGPFSNNPKYSLLEVWFL